MPHATEIDEVERADLEGDLITQEELASAVADDMGSDDPVVRRLWDDLIRGEHAKAVMAEAEMRRVIEFNQQVDHRFQEGMGQLVARIPLSVYLHWTAVHGHEFWDQPDSLDFFARQAGGGAGNPGLLIKTQAKATMIVERKLSSRDSARAGAMGESSAAGAIGAPAATVSARNNGALRQAQGSSGRAVRGRRGRWAK